jgi:hypothetical protein
MKIMLQNLLEKKPYLAWYVKDKKELSEKSALEHILMYGDWDDVIEAEKILGIAKMQSLFKELCNKKRVNIKPRTINYFQNYFAKYA